MLTYLYTDRYVSPALMIISLIACVFLLLNILLLYSRKSQRFMIINYTVFNYVLILMFSYLSQSLPGMLLLGSLSIFLFVYMQVLMGYIVSIISPHSRDIATLFPIFYSVFLLGNLIKVYFVDPYRQSFQKIVFVFLIIQGFGFLFITAVSIKKLSQRFLDYAAYQQKVASEASSNSPK